MSEPRTTAALLARATRVKTLPVMVSPVAVGATLAFARTGSFSMTWFVVSALGAATLHLGSNVLNDYFDEKTGADKLARIDRGSIATGSGIIAAGKMTPRRMLMLAAALFCVALLAGVVLAIARGPAVLWLGLAGVVLAVQYVAKPLRLAYRGRGMGEVVIFAAFGLLPVVGSYYVQAQTIDAVAVWASIVPGLLTTLVVYHHHLLHWRSDKVAGKMTPIALLGPETGLIVSGVAIILTYVILILQVAFEVFPVWALLALITALPVGASWGRAMRDPVVQNCLNLLGATLGASVLTGLVLSVALAAAG